MSYKIIVIGNCHTNTLGLIRSLGEGGFSPIFVEISTPQPDYVKISKYIAESFDVYSPNDGIDLIMDKFKSNDGNKGVILPTSDDAAMAIDARYDEISEYFIISSVGSKQGKLSEFMDKEKIRLFAQKVGFMVPRSWVIDCSEGIHLPDDIVYPCVIKAINSVAGRKDFKIYHSESELLSGIKDLSAESPLIQIQQFIQKDFELLINGCILKNSQPVISCVLRKKRHYPSDFGGLSYGYVTANIEQYIDTELLNVFLNQLNYYGLFSVEFIVADGIPYFLEINLRNDGTSYISTYGGVNLPAIWTRDALDLENHFSERVNKEYYASCSIRDLHHVTARKISLFTWITDSIKSKVDLLWNWKDPRPVLKYLNIVLRRRNI